MQMITKQQLECMFTGGEFQTHLRLPHSEMAIVLTLGDRQAGWRQLGVDDEMVMPRATLLHACRCDARYNIKSF